jgi:hypothetical protein
LFLVLFALFVSAPALAETGVQQPPDVPLSIQPSTLKLPDLPADFVVEEHGWLRVAYPKGTEARIQPFVKDADEFKDMLADSFGQPVLERVELRIARSADAMAALAPASLPPPPWAVGVAYASVRLVLVSLVDPTSHEGTDVPEVARHELTHIALDDALAGHHVPLWFNEGLAIHFSGENAATRTSTLWQASMSKTLLPLTDIDAAYPRDRYEVGVAYAESADFVNFLLREPDRDRFGGLVQRLHDGTPFERAMADAYGSDIRRLEFEWREGLSKRFTIWPALAGGSIVWLGGIGILVLGWVRKRRRAKQTLDRWEKEEAAADALLAPPPAPSDPVRTTHPSLPRVPVVEHDGSWHTLH